MKDKKFIVRFCAGVMLVSFVYVGGRTLVKLSAVDASGAAPESGTALKLSGKRPDIYLTDGKVIDPETAPVTLKYDDSTAKDFAAESFADVDAPDINEFLSRFLCNACGKACLLTSPSCLVGRKTQEKATVLYQEMYPEMEF